MFSHFCGLQFSHFCLCTETTFVYFPCLLKLQLAVTGSQIFLVLDDLDGFEGTGQVFCRTALYRKLLRGRSLR